MHIWIPAEERAWKKIPINHFWSVLHEGPSQDPTALSSLFQWHLIWVTGACAEFIPYTACLIIKDLLSPYLHYIISSSALLVKHYLFKFSLKILSCVKLTCRKNCTCSYIWDILLHGHFAQTSKLCKAFYFQYPSISNKHEFTWLKCTFNNGLAKTTGQHVPLHVAGPYLDTWSPHHSTAHQHHTLSRVTPPACSHGYT